MLTSRRRRENTGNFISEWFGYRIYPQVTPAESMVANILLETCPFLTTVTGEVTRCIKRENRTTTEVAADGTESRVRVDRATGVCTINSSSDLGRRDWVACPIRILDVGVIGQCVRRLFALEAAEPLHVVAAPTLAKSTVNRDVTEAIGRGEHVYVFFEQRMGGEISIPPTDGSPEFSFDLTIGELVAVNGGYDVRRYGIIELQTADFHGSPGHAVNDLRQAADLYSDAPEEFSEEIHSHPEWLSNRVEGPNISNIFKRTFYQMMFKFQLGKDNACAGCALIVPLAVWESWQRHLGKPDLVDIGGGVFALAKPKPEPDPEAPKAGKVTSPGTAIPGKPSWIYTIVEPQIDSSISPNPLSTSRIIATDAPALSYFALEKSPDIAVTTSAKQILVTLRHRIRSYWPGFGSDQA